MLKSLNNLHHAYLVVGGREEAREFILNFFEGEGTKLIGSPDFFLYKESLFGIDEARELSLKASRKAFGERKVFLLTPEKITHEAQNALLKTFEDPNPDTHFFLVVSDPELILATLRSRMEMIRLEDSVLESVEPKKFLALSPSERLNFAKSFAEKEKNISAFLDQLLELIRKDKDYLDKLKRVYEMRRVSDVRAASSRLILEHLSLVL